jgi:hypothetical protein
MWSSHHFQCFRSGLEHLKLAFLDGFTAAEAIERLAVAGGMPRYLAEFSLHQPLKSLIAQRVLNRLGPLFNEPRALLAQELVAPHNLERMT